MSRMLFVCLGNSCRSPLAAGRLKQQPAAGNHDVASAGLRVRVGAPTADPRACRVAAEAGFDLGAHRCRSFVVSDFDIFDLIIALDRSILAGLRGRRADSAGAACRLLSEFAPAGSPADVPDPYGGTVADYVAILSVPELDLLVSVPVGSEPSWAITSLDGQFCFVSSRKSDTVSVISFDDGRELTRIKVGRYPQRMWAVAAE